MRLALRTAIIAAVVMALIAVETSSRSGVLWRLATFTYQANIVAAAYYLSTLVSPRMDARAGLRGAVVLYLAVAGLIWNVFLTGISMGYTPANILLHIVVPVLAVTDWILVGHSQRDVRWWHPIAWLTYPVAYLGLALLVLNHIGRRAPYYFLDPGSVGIARVVGNIALLGAGMLGLGYALAIVGRIAVTARARA